MGACTLKLYTIGFTKKTAARFFDLLRESGAKRLVDVRLKNTSQLARFAHGDDLSYFLQQICRMGYIHAPDLAPTQGLLEGYRKGEFDWTAYEHDFLALLDERRIFDQGIRPTGGRLIRKRLKAVFANSCLLCSEHEPDHCHRRLVAEYLQRQWGDVEIVHLI